MCCWLSTLCQIIQHIAVLIIFPLNLQTITITRMLSSGGEGKPVWRRAPTDCRIAYHVTLRLPVNIRLNRFRCAGVVQEIMISYDHIICLAKLGHAIYSGYPKIIIFDIWNKYFVYPKNWINANSACHICGQLLHACQMLSSFPFRAAI